MISKEQLDNIINVCGLPSYFEVIFEYSDGNKPHYEMDEEVDEIFKDKICHVGGSPAFWHNYMRVGEVTIDDVNNDKTIVSLAMIVWDKKGHHPLSLDEDETVRIFVVKND